MSVPRRFAVAVGLLVAGGLLVGCSGQPGVAAVSGDQTITTSELAETTQQLNAMYPDQGVDSTVVLSALVQEPIITAVAEKYGVTATEKECRLLLEGSAEMQGTIAPTSDGAIALARISVLQDKITLSPDAMMISAEITTGLADLQVTVNPRYGSYDPTTQAVIPRTDPAWFYEDLAATGA